jgi:hypothetical protein
MTEQTFRSPGFFEREIDLSGRTKTIEGIPAGVIGTALKGPAFVPVTVGSFLDFERKFGTLNPELFGPYAANAFLQKSSALTYIRVLGAGANTTTGDISTTQIKGTVKNAGFRISGSMAGTANGSEAVIAGVADRRHEGTVQYIAASHDVKLEFESVGYPIFTDNDTFNISTNSTVGLVRGMILMASGARMQILDHDENYHATSISNDVAKISEYTSSETAGTFKLVLSSAMGTSFKNDENFAGIKILTASLDPTSNFYIGKILNTSPDRFKSEQHLLYGDFSVESEVAKVSYHASNFSVALLSGSAGTTSAGGDTSMPFRELLGSFNTRYTASKTTAFISQPFGSDEYDLFHFESLNDGTSGNKNVKVSIANLRRSSNPRDPYGTFTVLIRDFTDTDTDMKVLEQYNLCTLNPADDRYVASLIGDMKVSFNFDAESESERRVNVEGKRPNQSNYVRIVMNQVVEDSNIPKSTLPFGFRGLPLPKLNDSLTDDSVAALSMGNTRSRLGYQPGTETSVHADGNGKLSYSVLPPVPMRFKATRGLVDKNAAPSFTGQPGKLELSDSRLFWGVKFERLPLTGTIGNAVLASNASSTPNPLIGAYSKFLGIKKLDVLHTGSGADAFCNNKFTLARVALNRIDPSITADINSAISTHMTGTASEHMREAAYLRDKVPSTPRYDIADIVSTADNRLTFASLAAGEKESYFNKFSNYLKFTNMMYGGFDGLNMLDRDSRLMNDKAASSDDGGKAAGTSLSYEHLNEASSPGAGVDNNIVNSYRVASSIMTDPLASRVNILTIPGIRDSFVTDHAAELTRDYSKAIYLMDIPSYDDDPSRLYDDATNRPNVRKTVEQFEGRAIDNNYVAAYFPDVIKNDPVNGDAVRMPASIAALGALAHNDAVAYPWFAPAGFNRGALSDVINTSIKLNTEDRNIAYEAKINPIANFPNGGFVIFGQKTLQQSRSALDRVNVRRMMLEVKRIVADIANKLIFENNTPNTRARFVAQVTPLLSVIQSQQGIDRFKVVMDSSNNTKEDIQQNKLNGKIILVPTRAIEFIAVDFIITNSGVSFE